MLDKDKELKDLTEMLDNVIRQLYIISNRIERLRLDANHSNSAYLELGE